MSNNIPTIVEDDVKSGVAYNARGNPLSVAGRIKSRRDILNISTAAAAKSIGLPISEYSKLEKLCEPAHQTLYLDGLAAILKKDRDWLESGDANRLTLTPNTGIFIPCDRDGIPSIDSSPYTKDELARLPFCKEFKVILKNYVKSVAMPFSEYFWYGDEFFLIFPDMTEEVLADVRQHTGYPGWENMKVEDQCAMFGLPLTQSTVSEFSGKPFIKKPYGKSQGLSVEKFALDVFKNQGWEGYFDEGTLYGLINEISMRALRLTDGLWFKDQCALKGVSPEEGLSFEEAEVVYPERLDQSQRAKVSEAFAALTLPRVSQLLRAIRRLPKNESDQDVILKSLKLIDIGLIFKLLDLSLSGAHCGSGWPDLVLFRDRQFRFVEVKSKKDVLRKNQALLLRMVYKPLELPFEVLHLVD